MAERKTSSPQEPSRVFAVGIVLGVAFGLATNQVPVGIAVGIIVGAGAYWYLNNRRK